VPDWLRVGFAWHVDWREERCYGRPNKRMQPTAQGAAAETLSLAAQAAGITAIHVIEPVQVIITLRVSALTTQTHQGEHYA